MNSVQNRAHLSRTVAVADMQPLMVERPAFIRSVQHRFQPRRSIADIGGFSRQSRGAEPPKLARKVE
jgi:hypothetical protein